MRGDVIIERILKTMALAASSAHDVAFEKAQRLQKIGRIDAAAIAAVIAAVELERSRILSLDLEALTEAMVRAAAGMKS